MVRQRDPYWEYAKDLKNGRFACKFCERDFAGGISRIKSHLSGVRGRDVDICLLVPDDIQSTACEDIGVPNPKTHPNKKPKLIPTSNNGGTNPIISTPSPLPSMVEKQHNDKGKVEIDKKLAKHFILNSIPFNVVETPAFVEFVKGVAEFGSGYELPSFSTFQDKIIPDFTEEVKIYIKNVKKSWEKTGCTLLCSLRNDNVIFMAYSPNGVVFLKSCPHLQDGMTDGVLKETLPLLIKSIGHEHVVQIIIDDFEKLGSTREMVTTRYPQILYNRCVANEVQSLLMDIYDGVEWVRNTVNIANAIVIYLRKNNIELPKESKGYKGLCMGTFAFKFPKLQLILEVKSELQAALQLCSTEHFEMTKIFNSKKYWSRAKKLVQTLQPLFQVLYLVNDERATLGYLYEAMERAKEAILIHYSKNQMKNKVILNLFEGRRNFVIQPIHAVAAFLNPAYMCSESFKENTEMKDGVNFILENLVAEEEKETFCREVLLYREKVSSLFTGTALIMLKTLHPRLWWDFCGDHLPVLKKYAVRILSQPCSTSLCKMNNLYPTTSSSDIVLRMNIMMMEKFGMSKAQDLEPINLEKLTGYFEPFDCEDEDFDFSFLDSSLDNLDN